MQDFKKNREGIVISILAEGRGIMSISKLFGGDIGGVFNNKTTEVPTATVQCNCRLFLNSNGRNSLGVLAKKVHCTVYKAIYTVGIADYLVSVQALFFGWQNC